MYVYPTLGHVRSLVDMDEPSIISAPPTLHTKMTYDLLAVPKLEHAQCLGQKSAGRSELLYVQKWQLSLSDVRFSMPDTRFKTLSSFCENTTMELCGILSKDKCYAFFVELTPCVAAPLEV
mmetsp:Transcript_69545/g.108798  ORF Transcript_69545/g.108798 Transcript_69545/m.108798 type:complete len:121 (-) Transcript_69545:40-402(-)